MIKPTISGGVAHKLPLDLARALELADTARKAWEDITPLARNEWICWVVSAKQLETKKCRIKRCIEQLKAGKRRPCCWAGCIHR